jgi:hypothetical protein
MNKRIAMVVAPFLCAALCAFGIFDVIGRPSAIAAKAPGPINYETLLPQMYQDILQLQQQTKTLQGQCLCSVRN